MAHQILISYSTRDSLIAESVCGYLEREGIACWIAPRDVSAAIDWDVAILEAIEAADLVLLILSSESNESKYVKRELMAAVSAGKMILPLRVEDVKPSNNLRFSLLPHQWVDAFPPPLSGHLDKVAAEIRRTFLKLRSRATEVSLISPAPGAVVAAGSSVPIRWEILLSPGLTVSETRLIHEHPDNSSTTVASTASGLPGDARLFHWEAPQSLDPGDGHALRIEIDDSDGQTAVSRAAFRVEAALATAEVEPLAATPEATSLPTPQPSTPPSPSPPSAAVPAPDISPLGYLFFLVFLSALYIGLPVAVAGAIHGIAFGPADGSSSGTAGLTNATLDFLSHRTTQSGAQKVQMWIYHKIEFMLHRGGPGFEAGFLFGGTIGGLIGLIHWFRVLTAALGRGRPFDFAMDELADPWDITLPFVAVALLLLALLTGTGHPWIVPALVAGIACILGTIFYRVSVRPKNLARQQRILGVGS